MTNYYCDDYKIAKVLFIDKELDSLPNVHRGTVGYDAVVREYDERKRARKTYYLSKPCNLKYAEMADKRQKLVELRKKLISELKVSPSEYRVQLSAGYKLTKKDWDKMRSQSNPEPITGDLWFENLHMRSRFELNTAIVLRTWDLEFKYEPELIIGNRIKYPDFVVYLPEFEVCFIIECMGKIGDQYYGRKACEKLELFMLNGYIPFRDFLVLGGTSSFIPTKDWVANAILSIVNSIAAECVFPADKSIAQAPVMTFVGDKVLQELLEKEWDY
ncbi:MAG: hypothetical protein IJ757_04855 [Clostridiales bacterium]|nr:hypothetical protein [Clostridiales bacterium]